jgi:hypothetical protein
MRLTVDQHLHLLDGRGAQILYHNAIQPAPPWIVWTAPDLCILHTTFLGARWSYDFERYRRRFAWIARLRCPKVALPQDEYDHAALLDEWLVELGATTVYSCFGAEERRVLYPLLGRRASFRETLTGFIDEAAAADLATRLNPHSERRLDIVYRARNLPYWFGSHGQLKHRIAEAVTRRAGPRGLTTDISTREQDTIYEGWLDFLMSGRAVIGSESGSSVLDPRGEIQRRISRLLADDPGLTFEQVDAMMPPGWDAYAFFAISPRHLEAVTTKTAQVLVEGRYSGVLEPERHYIPLRRDLSNLDEALERLHEVEAVEAMAERAYEDVYLSGRNNLGVVAEQLLAEARNRPAARAAVPFALARRPSLPIRSPVAGKPWRALLPHLVTLGAALARQPEARKLVLRAAQRPGGIPVRDAVKDVVMLRVLARVGAATPLSAETEAGTLLIRTETETAPDSAGELRLDGRFERVVWNHSAVAQAAPVFPRHPGWGWISLGALGRYEFAAVEELAKTDAPAARALVERALAPRQN